VNDTVYKKSDNLLVEITSALYSLSFVHNNEQPHDNHSSIHHLAFYAVSRQSSPGQAPNASGSGLGLMGYGYVREGTNV